MVEWFASLFSGAFAEIALLCICLSGAVFTVISILFGGDADHGDMDHGGDSAGDNDHATDGPSFFSIRGLSLFATGFGGVGYIVQHYTHKPLVASVSGLVFGMLLAMAGLAFIRFFYRQQVSSLVSSEQVIGTTGTVSTSISPGGGVGEVSLVIAGIQTTRTAIGDGGEPISQGSIVRVVRLVGSHVVVEKVS